jgi:hypothetical protein
MVLTVTEAPLPDRVRFVESRRPHVMREMNAFSGETKLAPSEDGANSSQVLLAFLAIAVIAVSVARCCRLLLSLPCRSAATAAGP